MSIAKFFTVCSKNASNGRNYSDYIKMGQDYGYQHFIHTNGFYAASFNQRVETKLPISGELIPISSSNSMLVVDYPEVNKAVSFDITKWIDLDDSLLNSGKKILKALENVKVGKDTCINPTTCEVFHDKSHHSGCIKAKYLSQFLSVGDMLMYHGENNDCHRFTILTGKSQITLCIAGLGN